MKKQKSLKPSDDAGDDLRPEYDFDYSKAKPNRFAKEFAPNTTLVTLAPDVAGAFPTSEAVNDALRSVIAGKTKR